MPKALSQFITNIIPKEHQWKIILFSHWDEIIGSMKDKVIIEKIQDNLLMLGVSHPAWAQELFLFSPILKKKINSFFDCERITTIRFKFLDFSTVASAKLKLADRKLNEQPCVEGAQGIRLTPQEYLRLARVSGIDSDLRSVLEMFFQRCKAQNKGVSSDDEVRKINGST